MLLQLLFASFMAGVRQTPVGITSETQLTLDGGPFHNETVTLAQAAGDWYVTASEAHTSLTLHTAAGARQVALRAEWEGKQAEHQLTNDTDPKAPRMQFVLTLERGRTDNGIVWRPTNGAHTVTVTVETMTDHDLAARVGGALEGIEGAAPIRVSGTIKVHRTALPPAKSTGTYGNCDPVIHDRLVGAEDRAPSECELNLDRDVRAAARQALKNVVSTLESAHWQVEETSEAPQGVPRGTDGMPFRSTAYSLSFTLDPSSEEAAKLQAQVQSRMTSAQPSIMADPAAMARLQAEVEALANAAKARIDVHINVGPPGLQDTQAKRTALTVAGAALAYRLDGPEPVTAIYLGTPFTFDSRRSTVSVQNIEIGIHATASTADRVLQRIDLAPLQALLSK